MLRQLQGHLGVTRVRTRRGAPTTSTPVPIQIAAGYQHACALLSDNSVWCWGDNSSGEPGDGTTTSSAIPVKVQLASATASVKAVTAGNSHSCAVFSDATAQCWGDSNTNAKIYNALPFGLLSAFRLSCFTSSASSAFGIDWIFRIGDGSNGAILSDLYDDAKLTVAAASKPTLVQSTGVGRLTGYDNGVSRADWGLGSSVSAAEWYLAESWGQVDANGGHCQDPGAPYYQTTLNGTGQYHIWVR